jgi:hypothetical protein
VTTLALPGLLELDCAEDGRMCSSVAIKATLIFGECISLGVGEENVQKRAGRTKEKGTGQ